MKAKKYVALMLSAVMAAGMATTAMAGEINAEGMPIVDEQITETMFGAKHPIHGEWADMVFFKQMEEMTNIHLEFETPSIEVFQDQKNLAFASGEYAGVLFGAMLSQAEQTKYGEDQGILIPLEDLVEQYCPNLTQLFNDYPEVKASVTAADGHIYALPQYTVAPIAMTSSGWVDWHWMEKIGMTEENLPTTVEGLYDMLKAMKDAGCPAPYSIGDDTEKGASLYNTFLPAFGIPVRDFYVDDDGKMQYGLAQEGAKEFFKYVNKLYAEQLLDPDAFTQGYAEMAAKGTNGDVGLAYHAIPQLVYGSSLTNEEAVEYPLLPALGSEYTGGKQMALQTNSGIQHGTFALTDRCENPEAMMRWVDYLYSEEGSLFIHYGPEGLGWKTLDNGLYEQIPTTDGRSYEERRGGEITPDCGIPCPKFVRAKTEGNWTDPFQQVRVSQTDEKLWPYHRLAKPDMFLTADEQRVIDTYSIDLSKYIIEQGAKFITGEKDIEEFDAFVEGMESMHLSEMLTAYQSAYDRWAAK